MQVRHQCTLESQLCDFRITSKLTRTVKYLMKIGHIWWELVPALIIPFWIWLIIAILDEVHQRASTNNTAKIMTPLCKSIFTIEVKTMVSRSKRSEILAFRERYKCQEIKMNNKIILKANNLSHRRIRFWLFRRAVHSHVEKQWGLNHLKIHKKRYLQVVRNLQLLKSHLQVWARGNHLMHPKIHQLKNPRLRKSHQANICKKL